ncbi:histidine--tRNA ligase [Saccharothrix sp. ALI-22-I]|uniref:histidine--tRNA ligase n=1 Tax=Saccharothrix sp. ALI-22-I TaxID=1933778 RepID=UPI00097BBDFD|nr:histidine--tRNA ligase [Saccharothrix sp. ALI-22-I]ONI91765.1 histidine--tRNA ligase [Saccharothrix sp. ALI-22-I]
MPEYLPTAPYRGTRDFLPPEMSIRTQVFHRLYEVIERYGFLRYDGPILESAEIYEAKSGREIADQQLYTLTDRGGRRLALRPEMTPSVARMIAGNAGQLQFPVRWYTNVNCHRYERPQRGRVREHWQINVDIFGSDSASCEIEIFELIHDMMATLGAGRDMWKLRANDRVLLESILTDIVEIPVEKLRDVSSVVDRWEKYPRETLASQAAEHGVSDKQFDRLAEALTSGPAVLDDISQDARDRSHLMKVLKSSAGDLITFDPLIVRAFEYYTSTVFEVFDTNPANNRSLFGGGRYTNLASLFTAQQIPGIGFGMGDVTLHDFLGTHDLLPEPRSEVDVVVIPIDETLVEPARQVARQLRAGGLRTSTPLELRKLGKELARANRAGARAVVIIGPDEWNSGTVVVRGMATQNQQQVSVDAALQAVLAVTGESQTPAS